MNERLREENTTAVGERHLFNTSQHPQLRVCLLKVHPVDLVHQVLDDTGVFDSASSKITRVGELIQARSFTAAASLPLLPHQEQLVSLGLHLTLHHLDHSSLSIGSPEEVNILEILSKIIQIFGRFR